MTERTDGEALAWMGLDAMRWAMEFMRIQRSPTAPNLDEGVMVPWFANAIEAGRSAGMKATCPHSDVHELSSTVSYCRTCGTVFDGGVAT